MTQACIYVNMWQMLYNSLYNVNEYKIHVLYLTHCTCTLYAHSTLLCITRSSPFCYSCYIKKSCCSDTICFFEICPLFESTGYGEEDKQRDISLTMTLNLVEHYEIRQLSGNFHQQSATFVLEVQFH